MYLNVDLLVCDIVDQCPSGCKCTKQPSTLTIYVNCTRANLTEMPLKLPPIKQRSLQKYSLILSENQIKKTWVSRLHAEDEIFGCQPCCSYWNRRRCVEGAFPFISYVNLNGNQLKQIPEYVERLDFSNIILDIRDNPISCDCKNQWLKSWIDVLGSGFQNIIGINCYEPYWLTGKGIATLDKEEFCRGPPYTIQDILEITIPSISGVILLNVISVFLFKRFRIQIYKYVKLHPFDRDECIGEDIDYDVFLACAGEDGALGYSIHEIVGEEWLQSLLPQERFHPRGAHHREHHASGQEEQTNGVCLDWQLHQERLVHGGIPSIPLSRSSTEQKATGGASGWSTRVGERGDVLGNFETICQDTLTSNMRASPGRISWCTPCRSTGWTRMMWVHMQKKTKILWCSWHEHISYVQVVWNSLIRQLE